MPLTARGFIDKRRNYNEEFTTHRMPQMDYLEANLRVMINTLNAQQPRDAQRISKLQAQADALHTVAHSHESVFNRESTLQNALNTLGSLMDVLEENNAQNLDMLKEVAENSPELMNDLAQEDKFKGILNTVKEVGSFCELDIYPRVQKRVNEDHRMRIQAKRESEAGYRAYWGVTGRQARFLGRLFELAAEDMEKNGGDSRRVNRLKHYGYHFSDLNNPYLSNDTLEARLEGLRRIPEMLEEDNGMDLNLLNETLKNHPEVMDYLPDDPAVKNKSIAQHFSDLGNYFELQFSPKFRGILDLEDSGERRMREDEERRRQDYEARRAREIRDQEERDLRAEIAQEEEQARQEDEAERQKAAEEQRQAEEQKAAELQEKEAFRQQNGPFKIPEGYDNNDVASMFVNSAKNRGEEYMALRRFSNRLGENLQAWNNYAPEEYARRLPEAMKDLPDEPTEEQRTNAVDQAVGSISPEEREQQLRSYYPADYEERLAAEQAKLPQDADPQQAQIKLYKAAVTEQYKDELRRVKYGSEKIKQAQEEAALELARNNLNNASQEEKTRFEQEKEQRSNDVIARQVKNQVIEAYRPYQNEFLYRRYPNQRTRQEFARNHMSNFAFRSAYQAAKTEEQRDKLIYETSMGELMDIALTNQEDWESLGQSLQNYGKPQSLADPEGKLSPLDVALKKAQEGPVAQQVEKELLLDRAQDIPQREIDGLMEQKLPIDQNDQQILYSWAKDLKKEQLQEQIIKDREEQFPDIAKTGPKQLAELHKQTRTVLFACEQVLPDAKKDDAPLLDYEHEVSIDKNISVEQKKMLKAEYNKQLEEVKNQKAREIHPKLTTKEDAKLREEMQRDAIRRSGMSEEELHKERMTALKNKQLADRNRRIFKKDWKKRVSQAEEEKQLKADDAKNKNVKDRIPQAGTATAAMLGTLGTLKLSDGELGKAFNDLDKAFTKGDLKQGKELRNKLQIGEEIKPVPKHVAEEKEAEKKTGLKNKEPEAVEKLREKVAQKKASQNKKPYVFTEAYKEKKRQEDLRKAQEEERRARETEKRVRAAELKYRKTNLKNNIEVLFSDVKNTPDMSQEMKDWSLSTILASSVLMKDAQSIQDMSNEKIEAKANEIRNSTAYKMLFGKKKPDYLANESADDLIADYEKNARMIAAYAKTKEQQEALEGTFAGIVDSLEATGSGKIAKFIPRGPAGNSTAYKDALAAIKSTKENSGKLSADELYQNTQTVLKYLDKKEKVRTRAFGRERWNQCMSFLKKTMPADKFKAYCDHVNQVRGVDKDPNHKDYVTPESFEPAPKKEIKIDVPITDKNGPTIPDPLSK